MRNPLKCLSKKDVTVWICSLILVTASNIAVKSDMLTASAALIGVTSLVFAASGHVMSQFLMIVFSIMYGIISWRTCYYGEMITYLCMTLPMAAWSAVTWLKNPSETGGTVKIQKLTSRPIIAVAASTAAVTTALGYLLYRLDTPRLVFAVASVATSFAAAALTMLRSPYYAAAYAANDIILIVLWTAASLKDPSCIPVIVNFAVFLFNDMYGFISWKKREGN